MTPTYLLAQLLQDPARAAEVPPEEIPAVLGELEQLKATLWAQLIFQGRNGQPEAPAGDRGRLLTIPDVANLLAVPKGHVYELARRGGLPFPRTAQGFGRRLTSFKRVIELELRVRLSEKRGWRRIRWLLKHYGPDAVKPNRAVERFARHLLRRRMRPRHP